jgi:hypothetical protein
VLELDEEPPAPIITTASGLELNEEVYHVDMERSSAELMWVITGACEVLLIIHSQHYHDEGKKVVCYISAGTWEPYR